MNKAFDETAIGPDAQEVLRAEVQAVIERDSLSVAEAAKDAGIAYSTFHAWLKGTYAGNNDKIAGEAKRWLEARKERTEAVSVLPNAPAFLMTPTAERIHSVLQYAQFAHDMAVVAGGPGIGKTVTLRNYRDTTPNVWLATIEPSTGTTNGMLRELCSELRLLEKDNAKLARAVCNRVADTNGLIIIDEAQHLATTALDQLRAIHDRTGVGIVMVGNEAVYARLEGGGRKAQFAQLFSRVGMRHTQAGPREADITKLAEAWGASADELKLLRVIAKKPGALRGMTKTLSLASMIAAGAGVQRGPDHIKQAWGRLAPDERLGAA